MANADELGVELADQTAVVAYDGLLPEAESQRIVAETRRITRVDPEPGVAAQVVDIEGSLAHPAPGPPLSAQLGWPGAPGDPSSEHPAL